MRGQNNCHIGVMLVVHTSSMAKYVAQVLASKGTMSRSTVQGVRVIWHQKHEMKVEI